MNTLAATLDASIEALLPELGPSRGLGTTFPPDLRAKLLAAMPGLKERAKTLVELADSAWFIVADRPLALDEKASAILDADAKGVLRAVLPGLRAVTDWSAQAAEAAVRAYAEQSGLKLGKVAQPLRAALTGRSTSPGVFDVLAVLGRDESLARISDQID